MLAGLAVGETNRQVTRALVISERTVEVHVLSLLAKFGARTSGEAAAHRLQLAPTAEFA